MELNKYMFREYDIRGVYGKDIDEEVSDDAVPYQSSTNRKSICN